ncbi:MAG: hypothetical protein E7240_00985 [Lachnospiraceae bacterium]|nr:hypothetical protein [Lachnospiraceae bacterium]
MSDNRKILTDKERPYPRICAHRGFNTIAPENSMPAFGAAIAMGADEIEFDLWWTTDGEIVSIHDPVLDRVSDGTGFVYEHSYKELLEYDFGVKTAPEFAGLRILRFEEILEKLACRTIMNIHLKSAKCTEIEYREAAPRCTESRIAVNFFTRNSEQFVNWIPEGHLEKIIALIRKYHAEDYCYFKVGEHEILKILLENAPEIARCAGAGEDPHEDYAETAIRYNCRKIQLFQPHFEMNPPDYVSKMIDKCHRNNIRVNYFWTDDPQEAVRCLEKGVDTVLTNDYHRVAVSAKEWLEAGRKTN